MSFATWRGPRGISIGFHQRLDVRQPVLGLLPLGARERRLDFLGLGRLGTAQVGEALLDIGGLSRQLDIARGKLDLSQLELAGHDAVDNALGPRGLLVGGVDLRFRHHLVGHHADRQQDADSASQAKLVSDTIELDHVDDPQFQMALVAPKPRLTPCCFAYRLTGEEVTFG